MDFYGWVLLAAVALGLAAGIALTVRLYLANPVRLAGLGAAVAAIAIRAALAYLPKLIAFLGARMPPEEEAEWHRAERQGRGDEWLRERWRRNRRKGLGKP
jgi:uncharacterized membrane protein YdfJ with MMPL/SSD domain